jgi:RNA polymerase sigma factor (sigma-70 family)
MLRMTAGTSVTLWIKQLKAGDNEAFEKLWLRYFDRLVAVARKKLGRARKRAYDEDDVAASVFKSLWRGAERGHFQRLSTRDDLWALLLAMVHQKVVDYIRRDTRQKRGGGRLGGESKLPLDGIQQLISQEPTPDVMALIDEQHRMLMDRLPDDTLRQIATMRFEGHSTKEIAAKFNYTVRWTERKLQIIREKWGAELSQ